jgi:hypothetical protein
LCGFQKPGAPAINQILKAVEWMYKVWFKEECLLLLFSEPKYTLVNALVSLIGLEHPLVTRLS